MKRTRRRKCRHCQGLFRPDPRCRERQRYCSAAQCRKASKAASQRRWLSKSENRDYFKGPDHVDRVRVWRERHPGYSRCRRPLSDAALQEQRSTQAADYKKEPGVLTAPPLQDLISQQAPVLVGVIATLSGQALQDDIATTMRRLIRLGADILAQPQGGPDGTQTFTSPKSSTPTSGPVQLDRPTLGP